VKGFFERGRLGEFGGKKPVGGKKLGIRRPSGKAAGLVGRRGSGLAWG